MAADTLFDPYVMGIGAAMTAGANIYLAVFGRRPKFLPPVREIDLLQRAAHILSVGVVILTYQFGAKASFGSVEEMLVRTLAAFVISLFLYFLLLSSLSLRCPSDPTLYLGGLWKSAAAKERISNARTTPEAGPTSAGEYFCNNGRNAGMIWPPSSRLGAGALLFLGYIALIFTATSAVTSAWMLAAEQQKPALAPDSDVVPNLPEAITIPSDPLFAFGKADLTPDAERILGGTGKLLRQKGPTSIEISGHTDAIGSAAANQKLSERRAAAVRDWLIAHACLGDIKIVTRGYGSARSVASNWHQDGRDDPEGRALNRRVEIRYHASPSSTRPPLDCPAAKGR